MTLFAKFHCPCQCSVGGGRRTDGQMLALTASAAEWPVLRCLANYSPPPRMHLLHHGLRMLQVLSRGSLGLGRSTPGAQRCYPWTILRVACLEAQVHDAHAGATTAEGCEGHGGVPHGAMMLPCRERLKLAVPIGWAVSSTPGGWDDSGGDRRTCYNRGARPRVAG